MRSKGAQKERGNVNQAEYTIGAVSLSMLELSLGSNKAHSQDRAPDMSWMFRFETPHSFHLKVINTLIEWGKHFLQGMGMDKATNGKHKRWPVVQLKRWLFEGAVFYCLHFKGEAEHF